LTVTKVILQAITKEISNQFLQRKMLYEFEKEETLLISEENVSKLIDRGKCLCGGLIHYGRSLYLL
jgi:hypothetical protein